MSPINSGEIDQKDKGSYDLAEAETGIARGTLYALVSKKLIPHKRIGKRLVIFSRAELREWLAERHAGPSVSVEAV